MCISTTLFGFMIACFILGSVKHVENFLTLPYSES